jgi:ABC-type sugar transport system substrate-binding protein
MAIMSKAHRSLLRHVLAGLILIGGISVGVRPSSAETGDRMRDLVSPVTAKKPLKIGVTIVHLQDDFWKGIAYGIADEAKRSNVSVVQITVAGAYGNVSQQFAQIQAMQTLGVDVAVVGPAAYDGYDAILAGLKKSGKMVIAAGIPLNSQNVDFGVTQDDTALGGALADAVCKDMAGKPAEVLALPGPAGAEWSRLRLVGFTEKSKNCPGMTVIAGPVGGAIDIGYGLSQISDMLLKHPDAKYAYTPESALGMGAVQAGRRQKKELKVATATLNDQGLTELKDGRFLTVISEPGILIGRLIVQYAIRKAEGMPMPNMQATPPYPTVVVPNLAISQTMAATYDDSLYDVPPKSWSIEAVQK